MTLKELSLVNFKWINHGPLFLIILDKYAIFLIDSRIHENLLILDISNPKSIYLQSYIHSRSFLIIINSSLCSRHFAISHLILTQIQIHMANPWGEVNMRGALLARPQSSDKETG